MKKKLIEIEPEQSNDHTVGERTLTPVRQIMKKPLLLIMGTARENILKIKQALGKPVPVPFPASEGNESVFLPSGRNRR